MSLNWTIEVVLNLVSFLPYLLSSIILLRQLYYHKDKAMLALVITWFSYGLFWLTNGISYLLLSPELFQFNKIFVVISAISWVIAYDFMNREQIESLKFSVVAIISAGLIYFAYQPGAVTQITLGDGQESLQNTGTNRFMLTLIGLVIATIYLYYATKMYYYANPTLKRYALLHLLGAILFGPVTLLMFFFEVSVSIPGLTSLISSFGILISAVAFYKSPQLIYTLPFTALRIFVVEKESGLSIYGYSWKSESDQISDQLFTTALESINIFTQEALKRGKIQEVVLENGVLIVNQIPDTNLLGVLVSSNSSQVLRSNLSVFLQLFHEKFKNELTSQDSYVKLTSKFKSGDQLIKQAFPYIPMNF